MSEGSKKSDATVVSAQRRQNFRRWLYKMEGAFERASQVADIIHKCTKEPSIWSFAKAGFDLANHVQQVLLINYHEHFNGWSSPYSDDYNYAIVEILKHLPYVEKATTDQNLSLRLVVADGVEMYYCIDVEHESIEGIHVRNEDLEKAREFIKKAFWDAFGQQFLLMHRRKIFEHGHEVGEFLVFDNDDEVQPYVSVRATTIAKRTARFIGAGVPRSILLYGPPGTGKSTTVRAVVRALNVSSLRIRVEDLEDITNTTVFEAIKIFEPECIIIDDLDRCSRLTHMLEMFERFNKKLKIVFATVNDKDSLGEAMLRPGRFDELVEVKELDEETTRKILGDDEEEEVFQIVKDWPIAFTLEFVKRRTYMSREEALESLAELHQRVKCLEGYNEINDNQSSQRYLELVRKAHTANSPELRKQLLAQAHRALNAPTPKSSPKPVVDTEFTDNDDDDNDDSNADDGT